jgi:hypothetical protein
LINVCPDIRQQTRAEIEDEELEGEDDLKNEKRLFEGYTKDRQNYPMEAPAKPVD